MAYVYKITRIDDMEYIGITVDINKRIQSHIKSDRFAVGIKKWEILEECVSYEIAEEMETKYIEQFDTYKNGLNLTPDGKGKNRETKFNTKGHVYSDESRKKMSISAKNRGSDHIINYTFTEEDKKKLSETRKRKCWGKRKISTKRALELYEEYSNFDPYSVDLTLYVKKSQWNEIGKVPIDQLKRRSGHTLTKLQIFINIKSKEIGVTPNQIRNIINKRGLMAPNHDEV